MALMERIASLLLATDCWISNITLEHDLTYHQACAAVGREAM
jgi:hypothetical protein